MKMNADATEEDPKHSTQLQLSLFQTGDVPKGLFWSVNHEKLL